MTTVPRCNREEGAIVFSEFDRLVHEAALRAAGAIHIRIIGINIATARATENAVIAWPRLKSTTPKLRINADTCQARQQDDDISENQIGDGHDSRKVSSSKFQAPEKSQIPNFKTQGASGRS